MCSRATPVAVRRSSVTAPSARARVNPPPPCLPSNSPSPSRLSCWSRKTSSGHRAEKLGYADIDIDGAPDFSRRFFLHGQDQAAVRALFKPEVTQAFEQLDAKTQWSVSGSGQWLVFSPARLRIGPSADPGVGANRGADRQRVSSSHGRQRVRMKTSKQGMFPKILRQVRRIPRGKVATYGDVAYAAGFPGAARQVVWALHSSRGLPWQRVVGAGGNPGSPAKLPWQRFRLENEGVGFVGLRVDMREHHFTFFARKKAGTRKKQR